MATIAENLQTIQNIKQDIKRAIENKGVDMSNTPFTEYSTKIDEISSGGGGSSTFVIPDGMKFAYSTFTEIPDYLDFSECIDMNRMFSNCANLKSVNLDSIKTTDMSYTFYNNTSLTNIINLNTSNVNKMNYMFYNCDSLKTIPLFNTSNVTNMAGMFLECTNLTTIPQLDTSNVSRMSEMFEYCRNLTTIPQLDTSNVTTMEDMFYYCEKLNIIPQLDTSRVENMGSMFYYCKSLQSIPLLNCGKVTNMSTIFGYSNITTLTDLGGFKDLKISITSAFLDKCPNLTIESLMNVINNLYDLTANGITGKTLKFGQTNLDKLTPEQVAVATAKGWTLTA